jgi:hypothetical protein
MNDRVDQAAVTPLAAKAMLVKLTTQRPTTQRREKDAEAVIQQQMGDSSLTVSSHIFKDKANPVRRCINNAGGVYSYHIARTLAWQDRGPRLLPIEQYEKYTADMRKLIGDVDSEVHALGSVYDGLVLQDIASREKPGVVRDFACEYPSYEDFRSKMKFEFLFLPLPDTSHFLFDVSDEDKAKLAEFTVSVEQQAKQELAQRMKEPLVHLVAKLKKSIGSEGAIFRDSAIENIVEQCEIAESLCMGDEAMLAMVYEVRVAIRPHALAMNQLRESPIVRAEAATKLEAVASRMGFLMGN